MFGKEADPTPEAMYQFPSDPPRWISPRRPPRAAALAFRPSAPQDKRQDKRVPDLQSQLEAIFDAVWAAEANWRFDDRLDQALANRPD